LVVGGRNAAKQPPAPQQSGGKSCRRSPASTGNPKKCFASRTD